MRAPPRLLVLLLFVVAGVLLYKPALKGLRSWRAGKLLEDSRAYAEAGNWDEARRTAHASYQITRSVDALRLLFGALRERGDPATLHAGGGPLQSPRGDDG